MVLALTDARCKNIDDTLSLQESEIDALTYNDGSGTQKPVPASACNHLKALKAWNFYLLVQFQLQKIDWDDPFYVNQDNYDEFRVSAYNPDNNIQTVPRSQRQPTHLLQILILSLDLYQNSIQKQGYTLAQEFCHGIKREKAHYVVVRDKKQWDLCKRKIESTAVAAINSGATFGKFFVGCETSVCDIFGMRTDSQFVHHLLDAIRMRGAMDQLISDQAQVEINNRMLDVLCHLCIDNWQSEPHFQHQNFAEHSTMKLNIRQTVYLILLARWTTHGYYVWICLFHT